MEPTEKPAEGGAAPEGAKDPAPEAPKYVTEEQLTKVLGTRLGTFEQKIGKTIGETLSAFTGSLKTELAGIFTPSAEPPPAPEGKKKDAHAAIAEGPDLKKLQGQVADLTAKAERAGAERDAEREKTRNTTLRQKVTDLLVAGGIEAGRVRHALGLLVDSEKRVRWADEGDELMFRRGEHDEVELAAGIKEWLGSDDGKFYRPPRGSKGSGDNGGDTLLRRAGPTDRASLGQALRRVFTGEI